MNQDNHEGHEGQGMNHDDHDGHEARHTNHERHERHETETSAYRMTASSPLSTEAEVIMSRTIGCAIAVHKALGPGFPESIYQRALRLELEARGLSYEYEKPVLVRYRGIDLHGQRVDLLVENQIVVEVKAVARLDDVHRAQLMSYLRTTGLRGGLLLNFHVPVLPKGMQRIVL